MRFLRCAILLIISVCVCSAQDLPQETLRFTAPKKRALVIGAQNYQSLGRLQFAGKDAIRFAAALKEDLDFEDGEIMLLSDADPVSQSPTAEHIVQALDKLLKDPTLDEGDLFVFYFSGHGLGLASGDYLVPTDGTLDQITRVGLPIKTIIKRLVDKGLKNVLFIADACRAGEKNPFGSELQELGKKANIAVYLSCAPGKRSYEIAAESGGAFTLSLIDRLHSARGDAFGILWASSLAQDASKRTFQLTEPAYGKYAQQPAAWSYENQDIVLANTPVPAILAKVEKTSNVVEALKKLGGTKARYEEILSAFAYNAVQEGQWAWAVKFFRTLDQTGGLGNRDLMAYAILTYLTGDIVESKKIFTRCLNIKQPYYHSLAVALNPTGSGSPAERSEACEIIYNAEQKFTYAEAAYTFAATDSDKKALLGRLLRGAGKDSKEGLYWRAREAQLKNDPNGAKALFLASAKLAGDPDTSHYACVQLLALAKASLDLDGQLAAWSIGTSIKGRQVYWALDMAEFMRDMDRRKSLEVLKTYIDPKFAPKPEEMFQAVRIAGLLASDLSPQLEKFATIYPYSPDYQNARWIAGILAKPKVFYDLPESVWRLADDPVEIRYDAFFTLWKALMEQEEFPLLNKLAWSTEFVASMLPFQDQLGDRPYVWREMLEWSVYSSRQYEIYLIAKKYLFPKVMSGKADEDLAATALKICMNIGEDKDAEAMFRAYKWTNISQEIPLQYAAYLAVRGNISQSKLIFSKLKRNEQLRGYYELYDGLHFCFKLSAKKTEALAKEFDAWHPGNDIGIGFKAFVGGKFFPDLKHFNAMTVAVDYYNPEFWYIAVACLAEMQEMLLTTTFGKPDESEQVRTSWVWLQAGYVGIEFTRTASYLKQPDQTAFTGNYEYTYSYIYDPERQKGNQDGQISFSVKPDGKLEVTAKLGVKTLSLTGTCDGYGNLRATSRDGWQVLAKIPPKSLIGKIEMLEKFDQQFTFVDPNLAKLIGSAKPQ